MTLSELMIFPKFLALSTRWITLEAIRSELESLRLDLWVRRIALERQAARRTGVVQKVSLSAGDPSVVERPVPIPWSCTAYVVGSLTFAS